MTNEADRLGTDDEIITAGLLVIGDEILSGRTKDKNIGYIADHLTAIGIQLREVRIVPDVKQEIVAGVSAMRAVHTYLFTTGGIGATHDDITADSIAAAFALPIEIDPRAMALMTPYYRERGLEFTEARKRMARIPRGADLIDNAVSNAPGFMLDNVIVMAGIPKVMQVMLDAVTPRLRTGRIMLSVTIEVRRPESEIAALLGAAQEAWPDVPMGSYPFFVNGAYGTHLVLRSSDEDRLSRATAAVRSDLCGQGFLEG